MDRYQSLSACYAKGGAGVIIAGPTSRGEIPAMRKPSTNDRSRPTLPFALASLVVCGLCLAGCGLGEKPTEMKMSKELTVKLNQLPSPVKVVVDDGLPSFTDRLMHAPTLQEAVADTLARIGTDAVPSLIAALSSPDNDIRANSARALARMGPRAQNAVPALIAALHDPDETVRQNAVRALGQIGVGSKDAIPELISMLGKDASWQSLGRQQPVTPPTSPAQTVPRYSPPPTQEPPLLFSARRRRRVIPPRPKNHPPSLRRHKTCPAIPLALWRCL